MDFPMIHNGSATFLNVRTFSDFNSGLIVLFVFFRYILRMYCSRDMLVL